VKQSTASHTVSPRDLGAGSQGAGRRWRPTPVIHLSAAVHLGGVAALALDPLIWPYVGAALVANHAALGMAGMMPRSAVLGANLSRLPAAAVARGEVALTFDDGPDPTVTPRILDLLDRHRARATFFCIGHKAERHAEVVREIARRGHDVENHSYRHSYAFATYGLRRMRRDIEAAQQTLLAVTGRAPVFFRAPVGLRSPLLDPVLARLGLTYVSWTRRGLDTVDRNPRTVLPRLLRNLSAGDILMLHDKTGARGHSDTATAVSVLPELLERITASGLKPVTLRVACHA
jgi:peptidoglycan/xylan/chitin deacetylase (PgdA/CDA1 family)